MQATDKAKVYKILAVFSYIISGFTSFIFLVGFGRTFVDKLIGFLITVLFEPSKPVLFVQIFEKHKDTIKTLIIATWVILEVASIAASTNYMLNQNNKAIEDSPAFVAMREKEKNIKELIDADTKALQSATKNLSAATEADSTKQKDNGKKVDSYNSTLSSLNKQLNSKNNQLQQAINMNSKKPMTNTISRLKKEIKTIENQIASTTKARDNLSGSSNVSETKEIILKLTASIDKNKKELNDIDFSSIKAENSLITSGYMGMFIILGKWSGFDAQMLSLIFFFIIFGVTPELLGNLFWYLYKKSNHSPTMLNNKPLIKNDNNSSYQHQNNNDVNLTPNIKPQFEATYSPTVELKTSDLTASQLNNCITCTTSQLDNQSTSQLNNLSVGKHSFIPNNETTSQLDETKISLEKPSKTQIGFKCEKKKQPLINGVEDKETIAYIKVLFDCLKPYDDKFYKASLGLNKIRDKVREIFKIDIQEHTAKEIVGYLKNAGLAVTEKRRGTFIKDKDTSYDKLRKKLNF